MTDIKKILPAAAFVIAGALSCLSCESSSDPEEENLLQGNSITVSRNSGESTTVSLEFSSDWTVDNTSTWFSVSPLSGPAGVNVITVTVQEDNDDLKERVSPFVIRGSGEDKTQYFVIQDPRPGFNITDSEVGVVRNGQELEFTVEGNVEYEATSGADWITVNGIEHERTLLEDNMTYSKYTVSRISMTVGQNNGGVRSGDVALTATDGSGVSETVSVSQMGELSADYTRTFMRRSVAMKFTATWCVNCPYMAMALEDAVEEDPDHIIALTMHDSSSDKELMYAPADDYFRHFGFTGLPTAAMNNYARIDNSRTTSITQALFKGVADEAASRLPSNTVAGGQAYIEDGTIKVELSIASKTAGNYLASIFVLEDGIVHGQEGGGSEYVHNDVVRAEMTAMWGDPVSLQANGITGMDFQLPVPSTVIDTSRLRIVAVINTEGTFTGNVNDSGYSAGYNDWGYLTDNAVTFPVNGFADFGYEN